MSLNSRVLKSLPLLTEGDFLINKSDSLVYSYLKKNLPSEFKRYLITPGGIKDSNEEPKKENKVIKAKDPVVKQVEAKHIIPAKIENKTKMKTDEDKKKEKMQAELDKMLEIKRKEIEKLKLEKRSVEKAISSKKAFRKTELDKVKETIMENRFNEEYFKELMYNKTKNG